MLSFLDCCYYANKFPRTMEGVYGKKHGWSRRIHTCLHVCNLADKTLPAPSLVRLCFPILWGTHFLLIQDLCAEIKDREPYKEKNGICGKNRANWFHFLFESAVLTKQRGETNVFSKNVSNYVSLCMLWLGYDICKSEAVYFVLAPFLAKIMLEYNWNVSFLMLFECTKFSLGNFRLVLVFVFVSWLTNACVTIFWAFVFVNVQVTCSFSIHTCLDILICDSCSVCFCNFFSVILTKPSLKKHNIDNTCISQPTILQMSDFAAMFVFFLFANAGTFWVNLSTTPKHLN